MASSTAKLKIQIQADLAAAKAELEKLNKAVANLSPSADRAATSMAKTNTAVTNSGKAALGAVAAFLSLKTAMKLGSIADDYGQMASRLKMVTSSADEYNLVQQRIMQTADRTYKPLADQQELFIRSSSSMKELGYATTQTLDFLDSVSSSLTINSASAEKFARANEAISKAMVDGTLSGLNWTAVMQTMPTAIGDIATYLGKTETQVKRLASEGKLSMQIFADAMIAAQKRNAELAENMPTTIGDAFTKLNNHFSAYIGELNEAIGATSLVSGAVSELANLFDTAFTASTIEFFAVLKGVLDEISNNFMAIIKAATDTDSYLAAFGNRAVEVGKKIDLSFTNIPANIKALIEIAVVEIMGFIEKAMVRIKALTAAFKALRTFSTSEVSNAYNTEIAKLDEINERQKAQITDILNERQKILDSAKKEKEAYLASKDATAEQTKATEELQRATEEAMERAKAAAEKYGITLDGTSQSIESLMKDSKLSYGELTSQLDALAKKLQNELPSAGKTAAQSLDELGKKALQAAALAGASTEELEALSAKLANLGKMQQQVDTGKAQEKARAKAISDAASLTKSNESYVQGLEKQVQQLGKGKIALLEYEIAQKKLTGGLAERAKASIEALKAAEKLAQVKVNQGMQVELLRINGSTLEADLLELETNFKTTVEQLKKEGNEAGIAIAQQLFDAGKVKAQIDEVQRELDRAFTNQNLKEQSIQAQVEAGQISQYEGQKRLTALHKETAAIVESSLPALEQMAKLPNAMGEQAQTMLANLQTQLVTLKTTSDELTNAFRNGLQDGIQSSIDGLVKGTMNLQEAALNFVNSIASAVSNIAIQGLAEQLTGGLMSSLSSLTGFLGGGDAANGTAKAAEMAATQALTTSLGATTTTAGTAATTLGSLTTAATAATAALQVMSSSASSSSSSSWLKNILGGLSGAAGAGAGGGASGAAAAKYANGGLVRGAGTGTSDSIRALISNGEYINRAAVVRQKGVKPFLDLLNTQGAKAFDIFRVKHATGGLAGMPAPRLPRPSLSGANNLTPVSAGNTTVENGVALHVYDDPRRIIGSAFSDDGMENYYLKIERNPQRLKSILNI